MIQNRLKITSASQFSIWVNPTDFGLSLSKLYDIIIKTFESQRLVLARPEQ